MANALSLVVIIGGGVVVAFPFYWQVATSLKAPDRIHRWPPDWVPWPPHLDNYVELADVVPLLTYLRNSLLVVSLVVIGTVLSCSLAAYGFARLRFPGRDVIFLVLISSMIMPSFATLIPQFILFQKIGWYNTLYPLIVPAFFGNAFYIFLLRQFFLTISPEMEDSARIDGAGFLRTLVYVILPLSKPAVATVAIFSFVATWNDFFGPLIFLTDQSKFTLPMGLIFFQGNPHAPVQTHLLMAMAVLLAAPCIALYFVAQRMFIQGIAFTGLKG
ncbi:MAG TPA: carbohydrate ABC transporter permease [Actinopolymorphaceae bacterium]|nr:carbohydrate ABC transporter permease [Actinopolymorphaceae bacterium]